MSETSWDFCGVFSCCTGALLDVALDKEVHPGDTVTCPSCKEVWTLGNDRVWRTAIQEPVMKQACKKRRFHSKASAKADLKAARKKLGKGHVPAHSHAYICQVCGHWHWSSQREHPNRIGFKAEFQDAILKGIKTGTIRMKDLRIQPGDELSAVSSYINDKGRVVPDFLVPASKRFAKIECIESKELTWAQVTPEMLRQTTVDPGWYCTRYPNLKPETPVWFYQFKVIEEALRV